LLELLDEEGAVYVIDFVGRRRRARRFFDRGISQRDSAFWAFCAVIVTKWGRKDVAGGKPGRRGSLLLRAFASA